MEFSLVNLSRFHRSEHSGRVRQYGCVQRGAFNVPDSRWAVQLSVAVSIFKGCRLLTFQWERESCPRTLQGVCAFACGHGAHRAAGAGDRRCAGATVPPAQSSPVLCLCPGISSSSLKNRLVLFV